MTDELPTLDQLLADPELTKTHFETAVPVTCVDGGEHAG